MGVGAGVVGVVVEFEVEPGVEGFVYV